MTRTIFRSIWLASMAVLLIASLLMLTMHLGVAHGEYVQFVLASMVIFLPGFFLLKYAWESVKLREPDMFTLIGVGILSAYCFSCFVLIAEKAAPEFPGRLFFLHSSERSAERLREIHPPDVGKTTLISSPSETTVGSFASAPFLATRNHLRCSFL